MADPPETPEPLLATAEPQEETEEALHEVGEENDGLLNDLQDSDIDHDDNDASNMRWVVLSATCLVMTCVYYSLDIPAALHQPLKDYMNDADFELHFNLLYTVYSFPNIVLPFFGGSLVDKFGSALCLTVFATLCAIGQVVFASGASSKSWYLMLAGRTIYGFGGESMCVAYSTLLSEWFAGKELALAFGIALAIARLGSVLNNMISPVLANGTGTPSAVWFGVILNTVAVALAVYILFLDSKHKVPAGPSSPRIGNDSGNDLAEPLLTENVTESTGERQRLSSRRPAFFQFGPLFWLLSLSCLVVYACILPWNNVASGILLERNLFQTAPSDCQLLFPDQCTLGSLQNTSNPAVDALNQTCPGHGYAPILPTSLNISATDDFDGYQSTSISDEDIDCDDPFWAEGCTRNYCDALHDSTTRAGRVMSIPYAISACLSPLLGRMIDRVGNRAMIASLASILLVAVHATLAVTKLTPVLPLMGQGLAYALYSSVIWPSVTLTVDKELTGTAFGTITSIQNIGLALFPIIVAKIYNGSDDRYIPYVELFFAGCAIVGSVLGIVLNVMDRRTGNKLNSVDGKGDVDARELLEIEAEHSSEEPGQSNEREESIRF